MSEPHIRLALPQDARQLREIYAPYVERTAISFETVPPTATAMLRRRDEIVKRYPYLVAEQDGERLTPHECLRTENGIAEAAHITLPDIMHFDIRRLLHEM